MMRRLLAVLCLILVFNRAVPAESLEQYLSDKIISDYRLDPALVHITLVRSDIKLAELDGVEVEAYPVTQSEPRGRFPMRVELMREGAIIEKGTVSMEVTIFADLPVPAQNIKRHELLTAEKFIYKRFDVTSITEKLMTDPSQMENCRARQNLAADRYVALARVEKIPDVENGTSVTIVGSAGLLEIRAKGTALQNGVIGENIKVKNMDSRKILTGKVTAPGVVEIAI